MVSPVNDVITVVFNSIIGLGMLSLALWRLWTYPTARSVWVKLYIVGGALIGLGIASRILPWNLAILMAPDGVNYADWVWKWRPYFTGLAALEVAAGCALLIAGERRRCWKAEAPALFILWITLFGVVGLVQKGVQINLEIALGLVLTWLLTLLWYRIFMRRGGYL